MTTLRNIPALFKTYTTAAAAKISDLKDNIKQNNNFEDKDLDRIVFGIRSCVFISQHRYKNDIKVVKFKKKSNPKSFGFSFHKSIFVEYDKKNSQVLVFLDALSPDNYDKTILSKISETEYMSFAPDEIFSEYDNNRLYTYTDDHSI
ncbi:hypothetical protein [Lacihabitans soyangensis]|uniref:Uncharacterized protein n=1 Tax=Lacihabitans soyangensis TaxID=869394 RepID=A0AAE3H089_9BACT|nr:hypothetical protein [Lacihabitans soyangensis]MCP9762408.1 hypothetical protein [Lacihabitans soyangensis]